MVDQSDSMNEQIDLFAEIMFDIYLESITERENELRSAIENQGSLMNMPELKLQREYPVLTPVSGSWLNSAFITRKNFKFAGAVAKNFGKFSL